MLQDSTILKNLVEMKRLPVLFIGSGFSKRYLKNYPTWIELLKEVAELIGLNDVQFEAHIQKIRSLHPDYKNSEIYAALATVLSDLLTTKLINQEINIDKILTQEEKEKYLNGTDCFKLLISKKFLNFEINSDKEEELKDLSKIQNKISSVLTTNYDNFLKNVIFTNSEQFISQDDLYFSEHTNYAEIYKLHGDVSFPNSIIITSNDYNSFNKNLKLLTAKVMTLLCDFPIIFLGYSLSDENIKAIFYDFINSFGPDVKIKCKDKFIFIEYKKDEQGFIEGEKIFQYNGSDITVKTIKTDNFSDVFKYIDMIHPVNSSIELREIKKSLKKLIVSSEKGEGLPFANINNIENSNSIVFDYRPTTDLSAIGIVPTMDGFARNPDELNLLIFNGAEIDYGQYASNWFEISGIQNTRNICVFTIKSNLLDNIENCNKFNINYTYRKQQFDNLIRENNTIVDNSSSSGKEEIYQEINSTDETSTINKFSNICSHILKFRLANKLTNQDCHEFISLVINKKRDIIANSNMRKLMSFYDYLVNYNQLN